MSRTVTSFDVARAAGVSQPTVSRALRNLPGTSAATRARVRVAAEALNYIPSDSARILSSRRTRRIAVVAEELTNPYYAELIEPMRRHLAALDLRTVVVTDTEYQTIGPDVLADGSYDGVILTTTLRDSPLPAFLTSRQTPHVLVNRLLDEAESPSCAVDNAAGSAQIAELLADLGHQCVAVIAGPTRTSNGFERSQALIAGLKAHGIRMRRDMVQRTAFDHDEAADAARSILSRADRPSAIVCGNDVIAFGVLSAAQQLMIVVPEQLTVIGFDDIAMAGWPALGLTTVRGDLDLLAGTAVELLASEMQEPSRPAQVVRIPTSLVLRSTHAEARV